MNEPTDINQQQLQELEKKFENKFKLLFRYKTAHLTIKVLLFASLACVLFVRSGSSKDIYLWFVGIFMTFIALAELFELEEIRHYNKINKKK